MGIPVEELSNHLTVTAQQAEATAAQEGEDDEKMEVRINKALNLIMLNSAQTQRVSTSGPIQKLEYSQCSQNYDAIYQGLVAYGEKILNDQLTNMKAQAQSLIRSAENRFLVEVNRQVQLMQMNLENKIAEVELYQGNAQARAEIARRILEIQTGAEEILARAH